MSRRIAVIIPTYGDWAQLSGTLDALSRQDLPSAQFEIIVANNNPDPDLPPGLAPGPNVRVIWQPRPGSYAARNAAIRLAPEAEFLFLTDTDCRPDPHWLSRGLSLFDADPAISRIAGHVRVFPLSGQWNGWSIFDSTFRLRQDKYSRRGLAVTANLAVRRSVFDRIGLFDEDVFSGGDLSWNRRATRAGIPLLFDMDMAVAHPARESFAASAMKMRRIAGSRFMAKQGRPLARRMPRLEYLLPRPADYLEMWRWRRDASILARLQAILAHYALGWIYNAEIIRLGFLGGKGRRS